MQKFKKLLGFAFILTLCCSLTLPNAWADDSEYPQINAKSYILVDTQSGAILAKHNEDDARPPASITKLMSAFVVLDEIKKGTLNWDDQVTVSKRVADIDEAQIYIVPNEKLTVKELFTAMLVYSANDATVALAEYVGGTEEKFVQKMNRKAEELGLKQTHFRVSTGLGMHDYPDPPEVNGIHEMSAHDIAIIAEKLIEQHPSVLETTSIPSYIFFPGTKRAQKKINWNWMLDGLSMEYPGVDGLKTGHTKAAGYCFVGTAKQDQLRYISVVMGATGQKKRFSETKKLLDYGFEEFSLQTLVSAQTAIPKHSSLSLPNGVEKTVPIVSKEKIELPIHKGKKNQYTYEVTYQKGLKAPIKKGSVVGQVRVLFQGKTIDGLQSFDLITSKSVQEASWIRLFLRQVGDEVKSWF